MCPMADQRRKFPREFKIEAVRRVIDSGETATEVARSICASSRLRTKKRFAATASPPLKMKRFVAFGDSWPMSPRNGIF